jgi:D-alanyl-D-alanine carboxypeptidase
LLYLEHLQNMAATQPKIFSALWSALAIAGVDGTLRNRMKGTAAEGQLRGKTGTLRGVYNLAGYLPTDTGYVPFVVLTKTTPDFKFEARAAADRVGAQLAKIHVSNKSMPYRLGLTPTEPPFPYVPEHAGQDDQ